MKQDIRIWWNDLSMDWKLVLFANAFGDIQHLFEDRLSLSKKEELLLRDKENITWRGGVDYSQVYSKLRFVEIAIILNLQELHLGDGDYILTDHSPINDLKKLKKIDILYHEIDLQKLELPLLQEITFIYPFFNENSLTAFHTKFPDVIIRIW